MPSPIDDKVKTDANPDSSRGRPDNCPALVVIYGEPVGRIYWLTATSMVIGRSSKCEIHIDQESISRNHAKIVNTGKSFLVRDLGTTNGTYVNDEVVEAERALRDGDLIKLGRTIFKFFRGGSIELAYHEEMYRKARLERGSPGTGHPPGEHSAARTVQVPVGDEQDPGDRKPRG